MTEPLLRVEAVAKTYEDGTVAALRGASFQLAAGEVVGLTGGLVGHLLHAGGRSRPPFRFVSAAALAMAISFVWVTLCGYSYNYTAMNTAFLNLWALAFWSQGLSAVIVLGRAIEDRVVDFPVRIALVWAIYVAGLMVMEYVGCDLLHIREISKGIYHEPALPGLIHGPATMKLYYLLSGLLAVVLDHRLRRAQLRLRRTDPAGRRRPPDGRVLLERDGQEG